MSTADKLNKLLETKQAIKQAIIDKGVEVADDTKFADYPSKIDSIPMEGGNPYYEDLYNLRTNNGTNMAGLFSYCTASELDLRSLDTSKVTNMSYMFGNCSSSVNIQGWDTSKVTNMSNMFNYFSGSIDISQLDTSNVTNATYMFNSANTDKIILTGLSFPKVTNLDNMFASAAGTTLDLSSWDISNITNISSMFSSTKYKKIDLTGWKTTNVTNMYSVFGTYSNPLEELIIPDWDMANAGSTNIFNNSSYIPNLKLIDLSRSNDATITKIASFLPTRTATTFGTVLVPENISQAAYDALIAKYWRPIGAAITPIPTNCSIVAELDEILPGKSTKVYLGACEPWYADPNKAEIVLLSDSSIATMTDNEVTSTGTGNIELAVRLIDTQEIIGTKTIVVSETDSYPGLVKFRAASTPSTYTAVINVNGSGKKLSDLTYNNYTDIYSYDAGVPITSIKFEGSYCNISELIKLNTSNITNMGSMFNGCTSLIELDLSNFNTSNVTGMYQMFSRCSSLASLDISNFDMTNVTNTNVMFESCTSLHTLRLDNCNNDTINKIITSNIFPTNAIEGVTRTIYCKEENAAGLVAPTNWVFSFIPKEEPPVEDIPLYVPGEFNNKGNITEARTMVNDTHTSLRNMFDCCFNLASIIGIEDWDTSNVTSMGLMFNYCHKLITLDLSNFNTSKVTEMYRMFGCCSNLTTVDLSNFDMTNVTNLMGMFGDCYELHTVRLDNCSNDTISKIVSVSSGLPTGTVNGETRKIYCKEENAAGLTPPTNWEFVFVD